MMPTIAKHSFPETARASPCMTLALSISLLGTLIGFVAFFVAVLPFLVVQLFLLASNLVAGSGRFSLALLLAAPAICFSGVEAVIALVLVVNDWGDASVIWPAILLVSGASATTLATIGSGFLYRGLQRCRDDNC